MSQIQKDKYKYQPAFQKKASNNIFIIKSNNFLTGRGKNLGVKILDLSESVDFQ